MQYVYILGAADTQRVKVGRTKSAIADRIAQLQTGNPFVIIERDHITTEHASKVESYLHALLATHRGATGEWFEVDPVKLNDAIEQAREYAKHLDSTGDKLGMLADAEVQQRSEDPTASDRALHLELLALYAKKKRIEVEVEKRESQLKLRMQTAASLGSLASWKRVEGRRLDQGRLKTEQPALFEEFSVPTAARRFVVSRNVEAS